MSCRQGVKAECFEEIKHITRCQAKITQHQHYSCGVFHVWPCTLLNGHEGTNREKFPAFLDERAQNVVGNETVFINHGAPVHLGSESPAEKLSLKMLAPYFLFPNIVENAISAL